MKEKDAKRLKYLRVEMVEIMKRNREEISKSLIERRAALMIKHKENEKMLQKRTDELKTKQSQKPKPGK